MRKSLVTVLALCGTLAFTMPASASSSAARNQEAVHAKPTLNLNSATVEQLEALPGIGRKTAERILEHRTKSGGFKRIEELMNVKGIGEKSFLKLKPLISVSAPKTDKAPGD
ncbi:MAG TPA: helix-hairpin-helix domain-containing protein [Vicinamibacterales bacterium]|nr:helix-hairpin-helix domain-containing protein [Vicinamibacterales bacterium]